MDKFNAYIDTNSESYINYTNNGKYKEYEFEQKDDSAALGNKISEFWKQVDFSNLKPIRPLRKRKDKEELYIQKEERELTWLETMMLLRQKGMHKAANVAKYKTCKICEHDDLGKEFADEAYEDKYVKKATLKESCKYI